MADHTAPVTDSSKAEVNNAGHTASVSVGDGSAAASVHDNQQQEEKEAPTMYDFFIDPLHPPRGKPES